MILALPSRKSRKARKDRTSRRRQARAEKRRQAAAERQCRAVAVAYYSQDSRGKARRAEQLGISSRTVRRWAERERRGQAPPPRGRPQRQASVERRNEIYHFLMSAGAKFGLVPLLAQFPDVARDELDDFLQRFRQLWAVRHERMIERLHWNRPGAVWAIDHVEPKRLVDGKYKYILNVRDLATHYQLAWIPVTDTGAETTCAVLASLFWEHGAPLVVKSDNGPGFIADETRQLFNDWGILHLRSPSYTPSYNGSCEAGGGSHKRLTEHQATLNGHPGRWTSWDTEQARQVHNKYHRPWGAKGASPAEAWRLRQALTDHERAALRATEARFADKLARKHKLGQLPRDERPDWLRRAAISLALRQHGYLTTTRRRITPRIKTAKAVKIC